MSATKTARVTAILMGDVGGGFPRPPGVVNYRIAPATIVQKTRASANSPAAKEAIPSHE